MQVNLYALATVMLCPGIRGKSRRAVFGSVDSGIGEVPFNERDSGNPVRYDWNDGKHKQVWICFACGRRFRNRRYFVSGRPTLTFHGTLDARPEGVERASVRNVWMNQGSGGTLVVKEKGGRGEYGRGSEWTEVASK